MTKKSKETRKKRAYIKLLNRLRKPNGLYKPEDVWIVSVIGEALGFSPDHIMVLEKAAVAQGQ